MKVLEPRVTADKFESLAHAGIPVWIDARHVDAHDVLIGTIRLLEFHDWQSGYAIIHRLACLFTIGILHEHIFAVAAVLASTRAESACARSALKFGSQSQHRVFRESTVKSMLYASSIRPKKNSREIAPF